MKRLAVSLLALIVLHMSVLASDGDSTIFQTVLKDVPDTVDIYGERKDSLDATVYTASVRANYLSRISDVRTEVISSAGLRKMACCNLADSFENSASVTVGYSDAVTGARQIRLLGLSGIYTQMLDENRPTMRGIAAPFGLSYVPGQWLESIQVSKGLSTVVNGVESITGQINTEYLRSIKSANTCGSANAIVAI